MDQTKNIELQKKCLESAEERMAQLDKENEAATAKQRTLANESCERRAARLECMRQSLEAETPEQRVSRLEQMSTLQQQRLEVETPIISFM